jgi:TRAP-type C4-dicarboxylate transport system substrate-binding protein
MKKLLFTTVMALLMLVGTICSAEPVKLKFATFAPPKATSNTIVFGPWIKRMNAEGTVKVESYMGGVLGRSPKLQYKLLQDGVADMAFIVQDYIQGQFPDESVFNLPFMAETGKESCGASYAMFKKGLLRGYDDIKVLAHMATGTHYNHTNFPFRTPADLKGRKIGVGSNLMSRIFNKLGAIGVGIPSVKTAENMSRGIIEGSILDLSALFAFRANDVAKHHLLLPFGNASLLVAMNKKAYAKLPPAAKATIDRHSGQVLVDAWAGMIDSQCSDKQARLEKDPGHTLIVPTAQELKQWKVSIQPVIDDWEKADSRRPMLIKAYQAELDRIRAGK